MPGSELPAGLSPKVCLKNSSTWRLTTRGEIMKFGFGQPVRRKEDQRFLTGVGRYVADVNLSNQAYLYFLRSPYAHARLRPIDVTAARNAPGVIGVFTSADVKASVLGGIPCIAPRTSIDGTPSVSPPYPLLASDRVRHVGQTVAVVVAETLSQ